ncbi:MAG: hypothetical protein CME19_23930 [Gemmatimonadetes bacterium]|nr:hypothetical protein [Gemmatimonadota bacterium]|tara:strand:- start:1865 stop:2146 length:282 start_codon:yes stop_codon:yes gene_type:complete
MTIGFCRMTLYLPTAGSLKGKRSIIKSLIARTRQKLNVSVAEIDANDVWQKAVIGVAVVANESGFANSVLSNVVNLFDDDHEVEVVECAIEML